VIILALAYSLSADALPVWVEHVSFYVLGFLVVYGLLDVVALARSVVRHGIGRAVESVREAQGGESVTDIGHRRSRQ
jgi:uncharacterized oligopeptide transporter (OPT) family protein